MASPKLALLGNDTSECNSSGIQLLGSLGSVGHISCTSLGHGLGKLPGGPKLSNTLTTRRRTPGTQFLQDKSKDVKGLEASCQAEGFFHHRYTYPSFISREDPKMTRFAIEHNIPDKDISGRHFLFDKKWKNDRMDSKLDFRVTERRLPKPNSFIPPLPRDYQVHRSNHINRLVLHKELSHSPSKPFAFGSCEECDLTGPAIVLPVAAQTVGEKQNFSTDAHLNRPRISNQTCSLFRISAQRKSFTYTDPVFGASAPFVQRLAEMGSLEGETVRQENLKKLKKSRRLES
ncbi:hypothetical protein MATL_G00035680 [Megalops atlanticus]|uniref:Uncharacterized protein n=1 Tax=Megalops atlanticus TaxID=7932 RepID=A0A9D3QEN7_MEGAT|nr:hypothetical protein MATL_G00035680 [Megalops atlanticus]